MQKQKQLKHRCCQATTYMYGKLDELDFTVAGKGTDGQNKPITWGHPVKLKFIVTKKQLKHYKVLIKNMIKQYLNTSNRWRIQRKKSLMPNQLFLKNTSGKDILVPIENTKKNNLQKLNENNLKIIDLNPKASQNQIE